MPSTPQALARRMARSASSRPALPRPTSSKRTKARQPVPFRLETHIFYLFSRILSSRNRTLNARLAAHGLDYPRWRVLAVVSEHPGASMLQLAELTSVDRTTLTHTVRLMVEEGMVRRHARGGDRRSVELGLTRRGAATFKRILPLVVAQNEQALAGLGAHDVEALRAHLGRILRNLTA